MNWRRTSFGCPSLSSLHRNSSTVRRSFWLSNGGASDTPPLPPTPFTHRRRRRRSSSPSFPGVVCQRMMITINPDENAHKLDVGNGEEKGGGEGQTFGNYGISSLVLVQVCTGTSGGIIVAANIVITCHPRGYSHIWDAPVCVQEFRNYSGDWSGRKSGDIPWSYVVNSSSASWLFLLLSEWPDDEFGSKETRKPLLWVIYWPPVRDFMICREC